jgi:flavin-dependent dehydrogenase
LGEARFDVLVVGGGINGAGIARDLAGRRDGSPLPVPAAVEAACN